MIDYTAATPKTYFYILDVHDNIAALGDETGNRVVNYEYDAWGNLTNTPESVIWNLGKKYGAKAALTAYGYMKPWLKKVRDGGGKYWLSFTPPKGNNFSIKVFKKGISQPVARLEYHYELGRHELHFHVGTKRVWRKVIWP